MTCMVIETNEITYESVYIERKQEICSGFQSVTKFRGKNDEQDTKKEPGSSVKQGGKQKRMILKLESLPKEIKD